MSNFFAEYPIKGGSSPFITSVADTDSIHLNVSGGVLTADLKLSSVIADLGSILVQLDIQSDGLRAQILDSEVRGLFSAVSPLSYNSSTGAFSVTKGNLTDGTADGIVVTGGTGAVLGSGTSIAQNQASGSQNGYLSSVDWTTFNNKQASGNYITALTGDVTAAGPGSAAATIADNVVTNAKLAQMATLTVKGNNTGGTANASDLTVAQVNAILPVFTSLLNGLVPLSGGGTTNFLRADGTWAPAAGTGANTALSNLASVAINTSLLPANAGTIDLGSTLKQWNNIYMSGTFRDGSNNNLLDVTAFRAFNHNANVTINWDTGFLANNSGVNVLTWNASGSGTSVTIPATVNQLVLGVTNTTTISATAPASSAVYTIPDVGTAANFIMSAAAQTIGGVKTFSSAPVFSALTASTVPYLDASKILTSSTVTPTELGYVSGVTSAIQTQLNAKMTNPMTTGGDVIYGGVSGTPTRLANGSANQYLSSAGGTSAPAWTSFVAPTVQKFTASPTGATNYTFTVTAANATVGATYTNNGQTFTVLATIAASTTLFCSGTGAPAASGTLTRASGSGDATITFSAFSGAYVLPSSPRVPVYIRVRMVGGGGGGGGSGVTGQGGTGGTGGNTTFGTTLLAANGGVGGVGGVSTGNATTGGAGGTASLGSGPIGTAISGGNGMSAGSGSLADQASGAGASSPYGGAGASTVNAAGGAAVTNSGSGGSGGGGGATTYPGAGGGAGGYVDAIITSPSTIYPYAVGALGTHGAAGTSGTIGGDGGSGIIIVEEYYQ